MALTHQCKKIHDTLLQVYVFISLNYYQYYCRTVWCLTVNFTYLKSSRD